MRGDRVSRQKLGRAESGFAEGRKGTIGEVNDLTFRLLSVNFVIRAYRLV